MGGVRGGGVLWGRLSGRALEDLGQAWEEALGEGPSQPRLMRGPQAPHRRCVS